ncbi:MAG: hypothetical protein IBJ09_13075 [Bacteroidia bacterium]|nr:hypothetical protein [Bacteroidia bacterium]
MKNTLRPYLLSCFLLMLPLLAWNLLLTPYLPAAYRPETFTRSIPAFILLGENISRILLFILTAVMPIRINTGVQKTGIFVYASGMLLYFLSWLPLILAPQSTWSLSLPGFSAPAWTPLLWLTGICLTGNSFAFNLPYRRWYFAVPALLFLVFHNVHTAMVYFQLQEPGP